MIYILKLDSPPTEAVQWRGMEFVPTAVPKWIDAAFKDGRLKHGVYLVDRLYLARKDCEPVTVLPGDWLFLWPGTEAIGAMPDAIFKAQFEAL